MTKSELIKEIALNTGLDLKTINTVIKYFMLKVMDSIYNKQNVFLRGFGSFVYSRTKNRRIYNVSDNKATTIQSHGRVKFKPSRHFKNLIR